MSTESKVDRLRTVLDDVAPKLDAILSDGPLNVHQHMGPYYELPQHLKRRGGICHETSWMLKEVLKRNDVHTSTQSAVAKLRIRGNRHTAYHVLLKHNGDGQYIDPTYQQFYRHVGLSPEAAANNPELIDLYPAHDIALIDSTTSEFQENYAENTHRIEKELAQRGLATGTLVGTTLDEKIAVFNQLWNFGVYRMKDAPPKELKHAIADSIRLMDHIGLL